MVVGRLIAARIPGGEKGGRVGGRRIRKRGRVGGRVREAARVEINRGISETRKRKEDEKNCSKDEE